MKRLILVGSLVGILLGLGGALAQARPVVLDVPPLEPVPVGGYGLLHVTLTNEEGRAQDNKVLVLSLDGQTLRRTRTGPDGSATFRVSADAALGHHDLAVTFIGTSDYLPATVHIPLEIRARRVTLETVPPLPGLAFEVNGAPVRTGEDGAATLELSQPGDLTVRVLLEPETLLDSTTRASFLRWGDSVFEPQRQLKVRGDVTLQAGFALSHRVRLSFEDLQGAPVAQTRVSSVALQGSNGVHRSVSEPAEVWLQANRVQRLGTGLITAPIGYAVESVTVDGSNVVNRYQQRFFAEPGGEYRLQLLLYSLRVRAQDALFGFPVGSGVRLQYPDGREQAFPLGEARALSVDTLARGLYKVQITGVGGLTPATPIALSRDQDVVLTVLSTLDLVAGVLLGLSLALGLLWYGRPHLIGLRRDRRPTRAQRLPGREAGAEQL